MVMEEHFKPFGIGRRFTYDQYTTPTEKQYTPPTEKQYTPPTEKQ